jgi:hypothetical protein
VHLVGEARRVHRYVRICLSQCAKRLTETAIPEDPMLEDFEAELSRFSALVRRQWKSVVDALEIMAGEGPPAPAAEKAAPTIRGASTRL